ncbi:hypothetical protein D3C87_123200 [compost metagenome]
MYDLYSLSQIIKAHPTYSLNRDAVHGLYRRLGEQQNLNGTTLLHELALLWPPLATFLNENQILYQKLLEETDALRKKGFQFVTYGEELFPLSCYWMQEPPLTLSFFGEPAWLGERSLAVVGSREPAEASLTWMEREFAHFCEENQVCIVSGGARGVDQKAHGLSLRKNNSTIVVLPSGLGEIYPRSLQDWMKPVLQGGGCFLSEYAHQQVMHKYLFHHRNRLIAALGSSVLLVEARRRSGTLITAQQALQLGRAVGIVPGHPLDPHFGGSLDLLSEGAFLVRDAQDLTMFFNSELRSENDDGALVVGENESAH